MTTQIPARKRYLAPFRRRRGLHFPSRFHGSMSATARTITRNSGAGHLPTAGSAVAVIYTPCGTANSLNSFSEFLRAHVPTALLSGKDLKHTTPCGPIDSISPIAVTWPHASFELWLLSYLELHPQQKKKTLSEIIANSTTRDKRFIDGCFAVCIRVRKTTGSGPFLE